MLCLIHAPVGTVGTPYAQQSVLFCRASISGEVGKASNSQVLGLHNPPATAMHILSTALDLSKRDTSLMLAPSRAQQQHCATETSTSMAPVFELGGQFQTRSLAALAAELFQDPALTDLCDKGLNGTLQRTKDGATAESRIQELAGGVPIQ